MFVDPSSVSSSTQAVEPRRQPFAFWVCVGLVSLLGVFVLPLAFPTTLFARSTSYSVGFNNRVAALMVIVISLAVTGYLYVARLHARLVPTPKGEPMPRRWLLIASIFPVAFTAILGSLAVRADVFFSDASYWQIQMGHWAHFHARIYKDFEFAYGPILFYWPAYFDKLVAHIGIGPLAGYMISLAITQVVGLAVLFSLLQRMPLSRSLKAIALVACTFGAMTPILGLNYTMFRFVVAYAALLWITEQPRLWVQGILVGLAQLFTLGISPEIGVAFGSGAIAYALYRGFADKRIWLVLVPVPLAGMAIFARCMDPNYFYCLQSFARGLDSEIVQPLPYVDSLLFAAIAMCPFAVAGLIRRYGRDAGPFVGFYVASLAMVSSALGRCDGIHVYFSGLGLALLALVGLSAYSGKWARVGVAVLFLTPIWSQVDMMLEYSPLLGQVIFHGPNTGGFDLDRLEHVAAGQTVYIPIMAPPFVQRGLLASGQLEPSYYSYMSNAEFVQGEQKKINEMHRAHFVLMPIGSLQWLASRVRNNWKFRIFRLGLKYRKIRPTYYAGSMIWADIHRNYVPVEEFGTAVHQHYMLYRLKDPGTLLPLPDIATATQPTTESSPE